MDIHRYVKPQNIAGTAIKEEVRYSPIMISMEKQNAFRDPAAAQAGGYVLAIAGILVAGGLIFHPIPSGGFEEKASVLQGTPWWSLIHIAIAAGFVGCVLGGFLMLVAGITPKNWLGPLFWGSLATGMIFFTGVSLINGWVMHPLSSLAGDPNGRVVFDAFNKLLIGYGWLGNPLFLFGLTGISFLEVAQKVAGFPTWLSVIGLLVVLLSWLRGIGSAFGLHFLEPFIMANVPAFLWLGCYGLKISILARRLLDNP